MIYFGAYKVIEFALKAIVEFFAVLLLLETGASLSER